MIYRRADTRSNHTVCEAKYFLFYDTEIK